MIYETAEIARAVGEDPDRAPIPERHKAAFRFTRKFVQAPWTFEQRDIDALRAVGLEDADIVMWAQIAGLQTWFTMNADGSGVALEGRAIAGPVLGQERAAYQQRVARRPEPAANGAAELAGADGAAADTASAFVATAEQAPGFADIRRWALDLWGFVPKLLAAVSLEPDMLPRHRLALELLSRPQSSLPADLHALARARAICLNRSRYSMPTARALVADAGRFERLAAEQPDDAWSPQERAVLTLATKLIRNSYKITGADAEAFRAAGLDDAAYVDVLNTVAIQASLDRMAAALGVQPDPGPLGAVSG